MSPKLLFILGQTATGKTARATTLARQLNGEIINCDSRQIYRGLNIITGKTDNPEDVPTHMVDIANPDETYSAYDFARQGIITIQNIISVNKTPIVVGGTGNYARMLMYLDPTKTSPQHTESSSESRFHLETLTKKELQERLMGLDKQLYNQLNPSDIENPRRLMRAIQRTENDMNELLDSDSPHALANQHKVEVTILLHKDQESLKVRISQRVDERLQLGAIEECQRLLESGYKPTDPGLATIGYQSIFRYLDGVIDYESMKAEWTQKERQYAKRQKTYLLKYFSHGEIEFV